MSTTTTVTHTTTIIPTTATPATTITADNVTQLFPEVRTRLIGADLPPNYTPSSSSTAETDGVHALSGYDAEQIRLMDEMCIVLDTDDQVIGTASKKACHLMTNISQGLLHRAFSVFLFHPVTKKLLLQRRATEKITFPDMWTNTCCSHPLAHPSETGTGDLVSNVAGAKRAAVRKLDHELGIPSAKVPVDGFTFLTRIHYLAESGSDGQWGEHEIDYILLTEADLDDAADLSNVNENEVRDVKWVSMDELKRMFTAVEEGRTHEGEFQGLKFTPWFKLICESMLFDWWTALVEGGLSRYEGEKEIRRM